MPGGYAELAVTDVERLHEIPENLDFAEAVAMIGTGRTAMGILLFAELGPDDVAVVPAAAGGLGTLLVQYAKNAGATVIGLAGGPEKTARVAANGADLAVDYTDPAWPEQGPRPPGEARHRRLRRGRRRRRARGPSPSSAPAAGTSSSAGRRTASTTADRYVVEGVSESVLGPGMLAQAGGPDPVRTLELRALAEAAPAASPRRPPLPPRRGGRRPPRPGNPRHDRQGRPHPRTASSCRRYRRACGGGQRRRPAGPQRRQRPVGQPVHRPLVLRPRAQGP